MPQYHPDIIKDVNFVCVVRFQCRTAILVLRDSADALVCVMEAWCVFCETGPEILRIQYSHEFQTPKVSASMHIHLTVFDAMLCNSNC
jgi:hypothetical protein